MWMGGQTASLKAQLDCGIFKIAHRQPIAPASPPRHLVQAARSGVQNVCLGKPSIPREATNQTTESIDVRKVPSAMAVEVNHRSQHASIPLFAIATPKFDGIQQLGKAEAAGDLAPYPLPNRNLADAEARKHGPLLLLRIGNRAPHSGSFEERAIRPQLPFQLECAQARLVRANIHQLLTGSARNLRDGMSVPAVAIVSGALHNIMAVELRRGQPQHFLRNRVSCSVRLRQMPT
mmetsp:Transcript_119706/g.382076  ORF Transcript_119706/g.382076 Transcript_119706/m.382076 type:complete len:234 (+) Transcript_119706:2097-2798(+)